MPAKKPGLLHVRKDTKADIAARAAAESAMTPRTKLTADLPRRLAGRDNTIAAATWKRLVGLYSETDGQIATAFDVDLLISYCLLEQEACQLEDLRKTSLDDWIANQKIAKKIKSTKDTYTDWVEMWEMVNACTQRVQRIDARLDGKRKLLHALSQSLYLTPRSRAGVAPKSKEPEKPDGFGNEFDG